MVPPGLDLAVGQFDHAHDGELERAAADGEDVHAFFLGLPADDLRGRG